MIGPSILSLVLLANTTDARTSAAALAAGDAHYARRAEGARGGTALPMHADLAIAEYRRALALDPTSQEARLRLLRAYFFRGGFCGDMDRRDQAKLFDEAKRVADESLRLVKVGGGAGQYRRGVAVGPDTSSLAETYLWAAVSWGQWAVFHKVSAAWQGAPTRIRDLAESVVVLDAATEQAGGHLVLGRLHVEAPRIPMLTGWVSRREGIEHLRQGLAMAPDNAALMYFLADALLTFDAGRQGEAVALLRRCASASPRPDYLVEDAHYAQMATDRLAHLD